MGVECSRQRKHHKQDPDLFGKTRDQYALRETSKGESGVRHGVQPCGALQVLARSWYNSEYMQVSVQRNDLMLIRGTAMETGQIQDVFWR